MLSPWSEVIQVENHGAGIQTQVYVSQGPKSLINFTSCSMCI